MPKRKLTDATVRALPVPDGGQVDFFDLTLPAFGVRVSKGGTRSFFVMLRRAGGGKLQRVGLGKYPLVSLSDARAKAQAAMRSASEGQDPVPDIRQEDDRRSKTFADAVDDFLKRYVARRLKPSTQYEYERALKHRTGKWAGKRLVHISRGDVLELLDSFEDRGKLVLAGQTHAYLNKFFEWAIEQDYIEASPMERVRRKHRAGKRERVLDWQEIADVWKALDGLEYPFAPLIRLLLLTGQRKAEVAGMEWDELRPDGQGLMWEMPGTRTKNKRPHMVPLSEAAVRIIEGCPRIPVDVDGRKVPSRFVFTTTGNTPPSGFSKAKARLEEKIAEVRAKREAETGQPERAFAPWVLHDLRRTMVTRMNEDLGVLPHVVEAIVNHISGSMAGVAGVYNRAAYLDERRVALKAWAERVVNA
ncbi:MAG: tyrosine-type recombinase/integrase [Beijerinckiaceae bacterium]